MIELKSYRDLTVWQKSMDLVVICYQLTSQFPKTEIYGLSSQIQRAAVSIPANIAEGKGRNHLGDYIRHLSMANGSLKELETHLMIVGRLGYLKEQELKVTLNKCEEIGRMLHSLIEKLSQNKKG
ncbi:four helix bundle protein [Cyanobacterium aponinum UTEX 3222]|uniref:Four helix bundle protein n=2 Tax=Cyanobacterium aponinum AL20115 TaxID=3090662 RepID=A0AAF0ZCV5_9CHRO|nr:four helix bundle protein [Cyanobacterium aponinum]WRL42362.1 four helix bundle protein [Cyanobacterium aponinum UTEX 3222]MBD2393686.1 four helix bundle protein [Cyanobacterium aponinum FACHB-4101]PHV63293.1 diversity-generating retroelement protein bAvd family protein [Cyanobacterium aponinum IPPAS B-1201]WPF87742.1 four helix bundle protein [Cyanobacterium aponinum AL20115]WPF89325.1 four helix bundle protein [Cyanobacterium aponinum AL20115]